MKRAWTVLIFMAFTVCVSKAQSAFQNASDNEKELAVKGRFYRYKKTSVGTVQIETGKAGKPALSSVEANKQPYYPPVTYFKPNDKDALWKAFYQVFNPEKINKLLAERPMLMMYNVDTSTGKINKLTFFLPLSTAVTPDEIDALTVALKANLFFSFDPEEVKGSSSVNLAQRVSYEKIKNKTLTL